MPNADSATLEKNENKCEADVMLDEKNNIVSVNSQTSERCIAKEFEVCVPVTLMPYAETGIPIITLIDPIQSSYGHTPCEYGSDTFSFSLCQKICVRLPVKYGVVTNYETMCVSERAVMDASCSCSE